MRSGAGLGFLGDTVFGGSEAVTLIIIGLRLCSWSVIIPVLPWSYNFSVLKLGNCKNKGVACYQVIGGTGGRQFQKLVVTHISQDFYFALCLVKFGNLLQFGQHHV